MYIYPATVYIESACCIYGRKPLIGFTQRLLVVVCLMMKRCLCDMCTRAVYDYGRFVLVSYLDTEGIKEESKTNSH